LLNLSHIDNNENLFRMLLFKVDQIKCITVLY